MNQLISNVLMQPTDAVELPEQQAKPVFYYSYEDEERLNNGGFSTFEDAKTSAIERYKSDLADLDLDEGKDPDVYLPSEFTIGECYPPHVIAKKMIPNIVDIMIEQLYESLIDNFCTEDEPTTFDDDDKQILTNALNQIFRDEHHWNYKWISDDCTTFKFKDILGKAEKPPSEVQA